MGRQLVIDIYHVKSNGGKVINDIVLDILRDCDFVIVGKRKFSSSIICELYRVFELLYLYIRFGECLVLSLNSSVSIGSILHDNLVYFHNVLFHSDRSNFLYQRLVMKFVRKLDFIVQTNVTQKVLKEFTGYSAEVIPLFEVLPTKVQSKSKIIYHISSPSDHKQNHFLGEIIKLGLLKDYILYSTEDFSHEINRLNGFNRVVNYSREELFTVLGKGGILINTSSKESFCLPLVEAASLGLRIISFDASYARCLLNGAAYFTNLKDLKIIFDKIDTLGCSELKIKSEGKKFKELIENRKYNV